MAGHYRYKAQAQIEFQSPWHVGSGHSSATVQSLLLRDSQERLRLPGSAIKGVLRDTAGQLSDAFQLPKGQPVHRAGSFVPVDQSRSLMDRIFGSVRDGNRLIVSDATYLVRVATTPGKDAFSCLIIPGFMLALIML